MTTHALKEWASTCTAIRRGDQILILRKGGISEPRFAMPATSFFLYPTFLHQQADLIQPRWRAEFADELAASQEPTRLDIDVFVDVVDHVHVTDPAALDRLDEHHILTTDYAASRLRWRPTQPLWALLVRAYVLEVPHVVTVTADHGGCVSWLSLPIVEPDRATLRPALDDASFTARAAALRTSLTGATSAAA